MPFNGAGLMVAAVLGNRLPVGCATGTPAIPHIQGGRLRALAVTSPKRTQTLAEVPTMAETGVPGQDSPWIDYELNPVGR